MIVNRDLLLAMQPIKNMLGHKAKYNGVTHGMSEAGYDIRLAQQVSFIARGHGERRGMTVTIADPKRGVFGPSDGRFALASAIEEFQMPTNLVGIVHDKSTWARRGLSVFNTVIEPGWRGFLTLELVYHGDSNLVLPAGAGIAQVVFHQTSNEAEYEGRYQDQANRPVPAKDAT
jgi:dCTP deaminase